MRRAEHGNRGSPVTFATANPSRACRASRVGTAEREAVIENPQATESGQSSQNSSQPKPSDETKQGDEDHAKRDRDGQDGDVDGKAKNRRVRT